MNPINYIKDTLLSFNTITGGTIENDITTNFAKYQTVVNSREFQNTVEKCIEKNMNQPDKLKGIVENMCKYKILDFIKDVYKLPLNIKTMTDYIFYILIGIGVLIFLGILILSSNLFPGCTTTCKTTEPTS